MALKDALIQQYAAEIGIIMMNAAHSYAVEHLPDMPEEDQVEVFRTCLRVISEELEKVVKNAAPKPPEVLN